jgi:hypothetical protein
MPEGHGGVQRALAFRQVDESMALPDLKRRKKLNDRLNRETCG